MPTVLKKKKKKKKIERKRDSYVNRNPDNWVTLTAIHYQTHYTTYTQNNNLTVRIQHIQKKTFTQHITRKTQEKHFPLETQRVKGKGRMKSGVM